MDPSPALFTYVAVRHTLRAAGVDDGALAAYLPALLPGFADPDRHVRIRRSDDETYHYLVDMVEDLMGLDDAGERAFLLRAHLGNYSLWLAGLFPDYIAARRSRKGGPDLDRKSTRLNSSHSQISYAVFCLKKKKKSISILYLWCRYSKDDL